MRLVRAFTSEESESLVDALYDSLSPDDKHRFEAEVEEYRRDIEDMRAALKASETQLIAAPPEKP